MGKGEKNRKEAPTTNVWLKGKGRGNIRGEEGGERGGRK